MLRLAVGLFLAASAILHTRLLRSAPAVDATVATSPTELRLWFSGNVEAAFTTVRLTSAGGVQFALGAAAPGGAPGAIVVPVPVPLPPDRYQVRWVIVGRDGHPVSGAFAFLVAGARSPAAAAVMDSSAWGAGAAGRTRVGPPVAEDAPPGTVIPVRVADSTSAGARPQYPPGTRPVRWLELAALVVAIGAIGARLVVFRAHEGEAITTFVGDAARGTWRVAIGASVVHLVAALARLALESQTMHGSASAIGLDALSRTIGTRWGSGWAVGVGANLALLAALLVWRRAGRAARPLPAVAWWSIIVSTAALALAPALTGHAAADPELPALAIVADWVHVLGAAGWIGGLATIVLGAGRAMRRVPEASRAWAAAWTIAAFHRLATPSLALVVVSGLVSSWLRVGSWAALTGSNYGSLVLVKVYAVALAAVLGAYHYKRVRARLESAAHDGARETERLGWTLRLELGVGALVLALTAALVTTPSPR